MKYFVIRVSREGDLAFVAEGEGPKPPSPASRPRCWRIMCHRNGQVTREEISVETMSVAIATMAGHNPGYLGRTEKAPFRDLDDVVAWLLDEKFEHDIDMLERMIEHEEDKVRQLTAAGDEVGVMRARKRIKDLWKRVMDLGAQPPPR